MRNNLTIIVVNADLLVFGETIIVSSTLHITSHTIKSLHFAAASMATDLSTSHSKPTHETTIASTLPILIHIHRNRPIQHPTTITRHFRISHILHPRI